MKLIFLLLPLSALPSLAQGPRFESRPIALLANSAGGASVQMESLRNMRCAWGDFNNDGLLDVIVSGAGAAGPVTKLFENVSDEPGRAPFTFLEIDAGLPQVQDGALAWGDMDNDGDLDLALTGSRTAVPTEGDLVARVFRNNGGGQFQDILAGPWLRGGRGGLLQWIDCDHDGDLDLLYSADRSAADVLPRQRDRTTRFFTTEGGNLTGSGPVFTIADYPASGDGIPGGSGERDVLLASGADWRDIDHDGVEDVLITGHVSVNRTHAESWTGQVAQVWMNRSFMQRGSGQFVRKGAQFESVEPPAWNGMDHEAPGAPDPYGVLPSWPAAIAADWNGNGLADFALTTDGSARTVKELSTGWLMSSGFTSPAFQPEIQRAVVPIPGVTLIALPTDLIPAWDRVAFPALRPHAAVNGRHALRWATSDFLGTGSTQSLTRLLEYNQAGYTAANTMLLAPDAAGIPGPVDDLPLGLRPLLQGCFEAVDLDRDLRPDIFQSGYDEVLDWRTELCRNIHPLPVGRPLPPASVRLEELTASALKITWEAGSDAGAPATALRYGISIRNLSTGRRLTPAVWSDTGHRLVNGTNGLLDMREFVLQLEPGRYFAAGTYRVEVRTFDQAGNGSETARMLDFTISQPPAVNQRTTPLPWRDMVLEPGDMDNDGDLDVVQAGHSRANMSALTADVTLVSRNTGVNGGDIGFVTAATLPRLLDGAMQWGDADNDGDLDLAMSGLSDDRAITRIYRNTGGGTFALWQDLDGVQHSALTWADHDNDGDLDLMVSGYDGPRPKLRLYENKDGGFASQQLWEAFRTSLLKIGDTGRGAMAWTDFDGDGDLDLFITGDTQDYNALPGSASSSGPPPSGAVMYGGALSPPYAAKARILMNIGSSLPINSKPGWAFRELPVSLPPVVWHYQSFSGGMIARAEWCDMDADGAMDLVICGERPHDTAPRYTAATALILRNAGPDPATLGGWKFDEHRILPLNGDTIHTLTCADWDRDGRPDILMSGHTQGTTGVSAHILSQDDGFTFTRRSWLQPDVSGTPQYVGGPAAFGHWSGNENRLDVMVCGMWGWIHATVPFGDTTRVFLPAPATNQPPSIPANLTTLINGADVTFTWDASTDDTTPQQALTYNLHVERVDGQPGGMPGMSLSTGRRLIERAGNVGLATTWTLRNLPPGMWRWRVQALDAALTPSGYSTGTTTFVAGPPQPPGGNPPAALVQWTQGSGGVTAADVLGLTEGRNVRLGVGRRGRILYSLRGGDFSQCDSGTTADLWDVAIGPEGAVAVGNGVILFSSDGREWQRVSPALTLSLRCVTRGLQGWAALGINGAAFSPDGINWTASEGIFTGTWHDVASRNGQWVAAGESAGTQRILTSPDGRTWQPATVPGPGTGALTCVIAHDGGFSLSGGSETGSVPSQRRDLFASADGLTFTQTVSMTGTRPLRKIARGAYWWAGVTSVGTFRSTNGLVWGSTPFIPGDDNYTGITVNDNRFTTAGSEGRVRTTNDAGGTWSQNSGGTFGSILSLAYGNGITVGVGENEILMVSDDGGLKWDSLTPGYSSAWNYAVAFGHGRFVMASDLGVRVSTDGRDWRRLTMPPGASGFRTITFSGSRFVLGGTSSRVAWSDDGENWNLVLLSGTNVFISALTYGNGLFMFLENNGRIRTSPDGITWTSGPQLSNVNRLTFAHDRFFATGMGSNFSGRILTSTDGVTWTTEASVGPGTSILGVAREGSRWLTWGDATLGTNLAGVNGLLYESTDLITWTPVPVPVSTRLSSLLVQPGGVVIGGRSRTILFSPDGTPVPLSTALPLPQISLSTETATPHRLFTMTGRQGQTVKLETSSDTSTWQTVETITLRNNTETVEFIEPGPTEPSRRFFRLTTPDAP